LVWISGAPGTAYRVEASTDLSAWSAIGSATTDSEGKLVLTDAQAGSYSSRFYRAVAQ
jgi:hypothetical protein